VCARQLLHYHWTSTREVYKLQLLLELEKENTQNCQMMLFPSREKQLRSFAKRSLFLRLPSLEKIKNFGGDLNEFK